MIGSSSMISTWDDSSASSAAWARATRSIRPAWSSPITTAASATSKPSIETSNRAARPSGSRVCSRWSAPDSRPASAEGVTSARQVASSAWNRAVRKGRVGSSFTEPASSPSIIRWTRPSPAACAPVSARA